MVLENLFSSYLARSVREGTLEIQLPGGRRFVAGDGGAPQVAVRIKSLAWALRIVLQPEVAVGDAYMAGALVVERGDIFGLLDLAGRNFRYRPDVGRAGPLARWWEDVWRTHNARRQARRNVEHHYDLRAQFYRRFLDEDMQYSCAYFARPGASLEEAQLAKERHIAAKLLLHEGLSVLDVGCGWGGLALRLAADTGARVHGVTLAPTQLQTARENAEALGLANRAKFTLTDYRDVVGQYDRVVSVGMLEHVGRPNYQAYFDQVARLMNDDGVALIHAIGRSEGPSRTQPWVAKHIFPGGYIPALSEVLPAIERAGLIVADIEILRLHYAETLAAWRGRFAASRAEVAEIRGEPFCRMWEFYLAASEVAFRYCGHMVFQLQLAKRIDAVPLTRAYIAKAEEALSRQARAAA